MKILALIAFALPLAAQVSINTGTITIPNEVRDSIETWRLGQVKTISPAITLNGAITNVATTITVNDATNIAVGDQIVIDTEALNVTAKAAPSLTVTRGASITTAAAHLTLAPVKVCKNPTAAALIKELIRIKVNEIIALQPSATLAAYKAARASADATLSAFLATTVQ